MAVTHPKTMVPAGRSETSGKFLRTGMHLLRLTMREGRVSRDPYRRRMLVVGIFSLCDRFSSQSCIQP
jgi:hypothetical protein